MPEDYLIGFSSLFSQEMCGRIAFFFLRMVGASSKSFLEKVKQEMLKMFGYGYPTFEFSSNPERTGRSEMNGNPSVSFLI